MTYKIMPKQALEMNGYYDMKRGKTLVSYCRICRQQQVHICVGSKKDGQETLYRFQCVACKERLNKR